MVGHNLILNDMDEVPSAFHDRTIRDSIELSGPTTQAEAQIYGSQDPSRAAETSSDPVQTNHHSDFPSPPPQDGYDSYSASAIEPASSVSGSEEQRIQAYAKLEFADGDFYMTTHAVELGRDRSSSPLMLGNGWDAPKSAPKNQSTDSATGSLKIEGEDEDGPKSSVNGNQNQDGRHEGRSVQDEVTSATSFSQQLSQKSSIRDIRKDYNALAVVPLRDPNVEANDFNMEEFELSAPLDCPLIPIQQPHKAEGRPVNKKSISRRHARIAFNFEKHYFELLFLGRNGGFLDDEWFAPGDIQPLVNGSVIQIGGLGVRFVLPDVPPGETGADEVEDNEGGGEMVGEDSNEELEESEEDMSQEEDRGRMTTRGRGKSKPKVEPEVAMTRRKGPGRPPKNGVMSKREQAQLAKQAREDAQGNGKKKTKTKLGRGKGKTAKALELEQSSVQPSGKRKYTKRKKASGEHDESNVRESTEKTESVPPEQSPAKPPKEKRAPKPPRSPSPVWDESKLTPEQLAKPQASYVILIHEALTNSKTGAMSLPQIYRAIERKYPYFKLRVTTQGWQSSVRHNLGQHAAFRKIERDGKGWMWGYDPDVSIEKEKKRRATPPPQSTSQPRYYPQPQMQQPRPNYAYPGVQYPVGQVPPNGQIPSNGLAPMNGYVPPGMQHSPLPPRPPFAAPGFPMILNAKSDTSYRSPYDPNPTTEQTPQLNTQQKLNTQPNGTNGMHGPPSTQPHQGQPPYPNYQYPATQNLSTTPKILGPSTSPVPPWPPSNNRNLTPHATSAIQKFKTTLLNDMDDKSHSETIIDSAINSMLDDTKKYTLTSDADLSQEKTIMAALDKMLMDLGEKTGVGNHISHQGPPAEGGRAAEVADQVVKSMPPIARPGSQPSGIVGGNGQANGLKHKRSVSAEEEGDQPPEKKKSV